MLTELPFGLQGSIFGSPMPFGSSDVEGQIYSSYIRQGITVVVMLCDDAECLKKANRNLRDLYSKDGLQVLYMPISDCNIPKKEDLKFFQAKTLAYASAGENVAIHCSAGIGRTGLFAACLARKVFGVSGKEAIQWVRRYISGAVETTAQQDFVTHLKI